MPMPALIAGARPVLLVAAPLLMYWASAPTVN